jgi:hypothetical protein
MIVETARAILAAHRPQTRDFFPGHSAAELEVFERRMARLRARKFVLLAIRGL